MSGHVPGRSFLNGEVGRDELLALTQGFEASRQLFGEHMTDGVYDVRLVEGDLEVEGPLDLFRQGLTGLVVTGSLVVHGCYEDSDDPESGTFVLGDMTADNVVSAGWLCVGGSLLVRGGLVGDYNDCSATIGGQTRAQFLHTEEHWFGFGGDVHVDLVLGRPRGEWPASTVLAKVPPSRYPHLLVPEVFGYDIDPAELDDEEREDLDNLLRLDHRELVRRIRRGEPILAATAGAAP